MLKPISAFFVLFLLMACDVTPTPTSPPITVTSTPTLPPITVTATPTRPPITVTPTPTAAISCAIGDQIPFVYHPARLRVIQPCVKILARIEALRTEADGDIHIMARLNDAEAQQFLNAGNDKQKGDLVVEPVCVNTPTQPDAIDPCSRDSNPFKRDQLPQVGDCVLLEGQLVEDTMHFDWREIHPLGRFTSAQGCPPARALTADDFLDPGD